MKGDAAVNGQTLGFTGRTAITDTGTSMFPSTLVSDILALMIVPPNDAATLHNAIPGSVTDGQGNFAFPCNTNANVALNFGASSFSISPKDYVGSQLSATSNLCQSNIVGQTVG